MRDQELSGVGVRSVRSAGMGRPGSLSRGAGARSPGAPGARENAGPGSKLAIGGPITGAPRPRGGARRRRDPLTRCLGLLARGCLPCLLACGGDPTDGIAPAGSLPRDAGADAGKVAIAPPVVGGDAPDLPEADAELVVPYLGTAEDRFVVEADLGRLDVHLSVDTTSSISSEIDRLQRTLKGTIVGRLRERVEDVAFGVSRFEDMPVSPFGQPELGVGRQLDARADTPFHLITPITTDVGKVQSAVNSLDSPLGLGGDLPESSAEALYQIATGEGLERDGEELVPPFDARRWRAVGDRGGVGFRAESLPVIVHITDAPAHHPVDYGGAIPDAHSLGDAMKALKAINARVIGIASGGCADCAFDEGSSPARAHLREVAIATRAAILPIMGRCPMGVGGKHVPSVEGLCPLVFEVDHEGSGLSTAITDAITRLLDGLRFSVVSAVAADDPLGFVEHIEASIEDAGSGQMPRAVDRVPPGTPDGVADTLLDVGNGTTMGFRIRVANRVVAPSDRPQRFRLAVTVLGDGVVIARRVLRLVVPAYPADGGRGEPLDDDAGT